MRSEKDLCLLCGKNLATQKNSHIFSQYLGNSIFGKQNTKKGHLINPSNLLKKYKPIQDTPKENYLFCPECEYSMGVVETIISNQIPHIKRSHFLLNYYIQDLGNLYPSLRYKERLLIFPDINPEILELFVYINIIRAHFSTLPVFNHFKLHQSIVNCIVLKLKHSLFPNKSGFLIKLENKNPDFLPYFHYLLYTSIENNDMKSDSIMVRHGQTDPFIFYIGKYSLIFSFKHNPKHLTDPRFNFHNIEVRICDCSAIQWGKQQNRILNL
ncbi:MAG: hypothetical protein A3H98_12270 [Bacteroidetes bacterium RIFCSPLOWO2_02_FULL_36_8]|nr:MAG: hypothetical protein A3H98_12270 [Bacteroidetes bacterium RIFCSPLOWO2_02_FULL_36_8]OFY69852.1 MAG: hypothetical protein A3G23_07465 [Bacteroidetes bacterium RIFCSPLOWO2_12_FULL_37_12]